MVSPEHSGATPAEVQVSIARRGEVARLFDEMAEEYDAIADLWYAWLFSRLHHLIGTHLHRQHVEPGSRCVDVGCGTGFQTNLLSLFGHHCVGVDIAHALLRKAAAKAPRDYLARDMFQSPFGFAQQYADKLRRLAEASRKGSEPGTVSYAQATATDLPFGDGRFALATCCGSTLNFVTAYEVALAEMVRVLRPGGVLFLEVENKYNLDLLWALVDGLIPLGWRFDQHWRVGLKNLLSGRGEHVVVDYPFETLAGETLNMTIWLFSSSRLLAELRELGLHVTAIHAIHAITNVIPSTILHTPNPRASLREATTTLAWIEQLVGSWPLVRRLGCSAVYVCQKR